MEIITCQYYGNKYLINLILLFLKIYRDYLFMNIK